MPVQAPDARPFTHRRDGLHKELEVIDEVPVAFSYHSIPYAVMMATPQDIEDFAYGFSIAENLALSMEDIRAVRISRMDGNIDVDIELSPPMLQKFLALHRRRNVRGRTSCGLCGIESVDQIQPPPCSAIPAAKVDAAAAIRAGDEIEQWQPLFQATRAAHAAAWCSPDGKIMTVREDVGRHNALDKLIGACLRAGTQFTAGFCLITSRCSYEMVQKSACAGIPILIALSRPTKLAIGIAAETGMTLCVIERQGLRTFTGAGCIV
ncbi:MAG: formate dehydrogenase accessory sulfurtransferase FdhD [Rhodomicrobium sp.]